MVRTQQRHTTVLSRLCRSVTSLAVLAGFLGLLVTVWSGTGDALVTSDSTNSTDLLQWWSTHRVPHVRGESCSLSVAPSSSTNTPHLTVQIYTDAATFEAATSADRLQRCVYNAGTNTLAFFCGTNRTGRVTASVGIAASSFALRSVAAEIPPSTGANPETWNVYGYYCSTGGCDGSSASKALDGPAAASDFFMNVVATCN